MEEGGARGPGSGLYSPGAAACEACCKGAAAQTCGEPERLRLLLLEGLGGGDAAAQTPRRHGGSDQQRAVLEESLSCAPPRAECSQAKDNGH